MSKHVADLLIQDRYEEAIAIVQVRYAPPELSSEEIGKKLAYITGYESLAEIPAPYAMFLTQNNTYVWKYPGRLDQEFVEFSTQNVIDQYLPEFQGQKIRTNDALQIAARNWLVSLTNVNSLFSDSLAVTLQEIGFLEAIQGGFVLMEVPIYGRVY